MTLLEKAGIALIALLIAAGGGGALVYRFHLAAVQELEARASAAEKSLESTSRALQAQSKAYKELDAKYAAKDKALNDALKQNPEWASGAVPDSVYDSLFGGSTKAAPAK